MILLGFGSYTNADTITFTGTSGPRSAAVTFTALSGNRLQVQLWNTAIADAMAPGDVLTAVFFNLASNQALNNTAAGTSALVAPGSVVTGDSQPPGGDVGGEWAYKQGTLAGVSQHYGISSTGVNIFGPGDRWNGNDLDPPASPNGVNYGLSTFGDNPNTHNGGLDEPLIQNSAVFILSGYSGLIASDVSNIRFQYGTDLSESHFGGTPGTPPGGIVAVPVPAGAFLFVVGGACLAMVRRRRNVVAEPVCG